MRWRPSAGLGQVEDAGTGLTYLNARYYDPVVGRFLSPDPLMDPGDPRTLDPYRYADNNPVIYTDPTGLEPRIWNDGRVAGVPGSGKPAVSRSSAPPDTGRWWPPLKRKLSPWAKSKGAAGNTDQDQPPLDWQDPRDFMKSHGVSQAESPFPPLQVDERYPWRSEYNDMVYGYSQVRVLMLEQLSGASVLEVSRGPMGWPSAPAYLEPPNNGAIDGPLVDYRLTTLDLRASTGILDFLDHNGDLMDPEYLNAFDNAYRIDRNYRGRVATGVVAVGSAVVVGDLVDSAMKRGWNSSFSDLRGKGANLID